MIPKTSDYTFLPYVVEPILPVSPGWNGLIEKYGDPKLADILPISLGDVAKDFDSDTAWCCIKSFPESERNSILRTIFPSVERAFVRITDTPILECLALARNYVLEKENIPKEDLKSAYEILKVIQIKQISDHVNKVIEALKYFLLGIHNSDKNALFWSAMAPTQVRLMCLDDEKEAERQVRDICVIYPPRHS